MIHAELVDTGEEGGSWQLTITGHASPEVCAAVTAMQQATAIWLDQMAQLLPGQLTLTITQESST